MGKKSQDYNHSRRKEKILEDQIKNILFNEHNRPNVYGEFDENENKLFPSLMH